MIFVLGGRWATKNSVQGPATTAVSLMRMISTQQSDKTSCGNSACELTVCVQKQRKCSASGKGGRYSRYPETLPPACSSVTRADLRISLLIAALIGYPYLRLQWYDRPETLLPANARQVQESAAVLAATDLVGYEPVTPRRSRRNPGSVRRLSYSTAFVA